MVQRQQISPSPKMRGFNYHSQRLADNAWGEPDWTFQRSGGAAWASLKKRGCHLTEWKVANRAGLVHFGFRGFFKGTQEERDRQMPQCVCTSITVSLLTSLGCPPLPPSPSLSPQALGLCSNQGGGLERSVWTNWKWKTHVFWSPQMQEQLQHSP